MKYTLLLKKQALDDISFFKQTGQLKLVQKINNLLTELENHPKTGTGQPEALKYELSNYWSRRIDKKNRLVYQIKDEEVVVSVFSARGHYE